MSWENIRITDPIGGAVIRELVFPNLPLDALSAVQKIRITNISDPATTLTYVRIIVKLLTGAFASGTDEQGQEAMDEKWVEVKQTGGVLDFKKIGGKYGLGNSVENYLPLSDMAPGGSKDLEIRVRVPPNPTTLRLTRLRIGVSYKLG